MITGESALVKKTPGVNVIAVTINGTGSLRVRVSAVGEETAGAGTASDVGHRVRRVPELWSWLREIFRSFFNVPQSSRE